MDENIKHYKGSLGEFDYDETLFTIAEKKIKKRVKRYLRYIGDEKENIVIPQGIVDISYMFEGSSIRLAPIIPNTVTKANYTFSRCSNLLIGASLPYGLVEANGLYEGCRSLVYGSDQPNTLKKAKSMYAGCICLQATSVISNGLEQASDMFNGCENLINTEPLPNTVKNKKDCFKGCRELKRLQNNLMY